MRIRDLADAQPDKPVEKRGPAVKAAFDDSGNPTRALTGFATSLGITPDQLDTLETDKGAWLVYRTVEQGKATVELMPELVEKSLAALPIPKRMRWGAHKTEFVRPVHWLILLFGNKVIDTPVMNLKPGNKTQPPFPLPERADRADPGRLRSGTEAGRLRTSRLRRAP